MVNLKINGRDVSVIEGTTILDAAKSIGETIPTLCYLKDINEIRIRAKETPLTSVTLDDIKTEKRLELCLESTRFQDLVRWGDAKKALGSQGKEIPNYSSKGVSWDFSNSTFGFQDKHMLLPIPLKERELNPNIQQNTGW